MTKRLKHYVLDPSTPLRFAQGDSGGGAPLRSELALSLSKGLTVVVALRSELAMSLPKG